MKIAIDTIPLLSPLTGVGHYAYQISKALRKIDCIHEYIYFYGYYSQQLLPPGTIQDSFYRLKEVVRKIPVLGTAARNLKDWTNIFSSRIFDLYFEPNFIPLRIPAQHIVATVPDFSFALFPEWHTKDKVQYYKKHFWKKIKEADRVIVISDFIRNQAIHQFGFPEEQLITIRLGVARDMFRIYPQQDLLPIKEHYRLPENFILFVGSIEPRKNLKNLLKAYLELKAPIRKEFKIVLAGCKGWENDEVMNLLRELKEDVFYTGYIPEDELGKFYNLARLFIYPSFYEGFGLPPLEAMACGCPVVVSNAASLPEVCGDAAYYVNPQDVRSIAEGMERVLADEGLRKSLVSKGLERIKQFSWEKSAAEHLRVFEEVFSG